MCKSPPFRAYWLYAGNEKSGNRKGFRLLQLKYDRYNADRFIKSANNIFKK